MYSPFLLLAPVGLHRAWQEGKRGEVVVATVFIIGVWLAAASAESQFNDRANWAFGLGPRTLFPAIPLFAAFASLVLARIDRRALLALALPSILCGYLNAQAGLIPTSKNPFPYAVKTWLSGTGMGIPFKEGMPTWLGLDTLHTVVGLPTVSASDVLQMLPSAEGLRLVGNQGLCLAANLACLALIGWVIRRLWQPPSLRVGEEPAGAELPNTA